MNVLITGATGLLGASCARALVAQGHRVVAAGRSGDAPHGMAALQVDFSQVPDASWWLPHLQGIDVVINAVGIFQESAQNTFEALHARAPIALFEAAVQAGVGLVIQISALGSDAQAQSGFHQSKHLADEALRRLPVRSAIVQPSLVYTPFGPSASLFNRLAALPVAVVPREGGAVQPVHLDDVTEAILALVQSPASGSLTVAAVGPQPLSLGDYLQALRAAMGLPRAWHVEVPGVWMVAGARAMEQIRNGIVSADAVRMLLRGNTASPGSMTALLGRAPRSVKAFLSPHESQAVRERSQLAVWATLMKWSLAVVWILTGLVSLGIYPVEQSLELLSDFGLHGDMALVALYTGGVLDLALGLLVLLAPAAWLKWVWRAQLAVVLTYTAMITLRIPHWWLHPFGPVSKNLPFLAGVGMLMVLTRRG